MFNKFINFNTIIIHVVLQFDKYLTLFQFVKIKKETLIKTVLKLGLKN